MSEPIRQLITRIMRDAFRNDGLDPIQSIIPILDLGMVNRVFRLTCSNCELILRMRESPSSLQEFHKEAWCLQQAASIGIPSPEALAAGMVDETSYLIETYVPGMNGSLLQAQATTIWEGLGWMARLIESIPVTGFGLELAGMGVFRNSFTPTWEAHIRYNLNALGSGDPLAAMGVYSPEQEEHIRDAFSSLLTGMETGRLRLGLLHGDLSPRNIIVGTDGTLYLIDWGCALVHAVPHYGLACLLRSRLENDSMTEADEASFRTGYGLDVDGYARMEWDVHRIALLDAFDKLRWALDKSPDDIPAFRAFAMRVVHEFFQ